MEVDRVLRDHVDVVHIEGGGGEPRLNRGVS